MNTNFKKWAALTIILGVSAFSANSAFAMQDNCTRYALQSAKQQQTNIAKKCGFSGTEWSKNLRELKKWCNAASPDDRQSTMKKRTTALASCK